MKSEENADRPYKLVEHQGESSHPLVEWLRGITRPLAQGDIGALPVLLGLVLIAAIFQIANHNFLSPLNLTNLVVQISAVGTISVGVVLVLLIAEIDLSVGAVSGLCASIMAVLSVKSGASAPIAIGAGVLAGAAGRLGIAAHGKDVAPEARPARDEVKHDNKGNKDDHGRGDAQNGWVAPRIAVDAHDADGGQHHDRDQHAAPHQANGRPGLYTYPGALPLLYELAQGIQHDEKDADRPAQRHRQASIGNADNRRIGEVDRAGVAQHV